MSEFYVVISIYIFLHSSLSHCLLKAESVISSVLLFALFTALVDVAAMLRLHTLLFPKKFLSKET